LQMMAAAYDPCSCMVVVSEPCVLLGLGENDDLFAVGNNNATRNLNRHDKRLGIVHNDLGVNRNDDLGFTRGYIKHATVDWLRSIALAVNDPQLVLTLTRIIRSQVLEPHRTSLRTSMPDDVADGSTARPLPDCGVIGLQ